MKKMNILGLTLLCLFLFALSVRPAPAAPKRHINSLGMEFVLVPAGSFLMGGNKLFETAEKDEMPQHRVTISKPFYLGIHEVTQAQWVAVMGENPSKFKGRQRPVEQVSWDEVQKFIGKLNAQEGHKRYRLPSEAEWEYAARAGTGGTYFFGDDEDELGLYAWYEDNAAGKTHHVAGKKPNPWGMYDMHGNVWEWVQDWYAQDYYQGSPANDPAGPSAGEYRVLRGGSWSNGAEFCRVADRGIISTDIRLDHLGFRLVLNLE